MVSSKRRLENDSDIDIMILLDIAQEEVGKAKSKNLDVSNQIDLEYGVVLVSVIQSWRLYNQYIAVLCFYQNMERKGNFS